jgi:glycosyltransferase 2 family protein
MNKTKLRNLLKLCLKTGFTAVLLYFVSRKIHLYEVKIMFQRSNPFYIILAFLFFLLSQIASSWRLLSFLKDIHLFVKFGFNLRLYFLGMFYNIFLPGGISGDGYKIYLLKKKFRFSSKKIFNAIFFDRLSGLWGVTFIALAFWFFIHPDNISPNAALLIFVPGTLLYYLIVKKYFKAFAGDFATSHLKALVVQGFQVVCIGFILMAIDINDNYLPYFFIFMISSIVAVIPFTIGGLGAREYVVIFASAYLNIDTNIGIFMSATFWLISAVTSLCGIYFVYNSKEFSALPAEEISKR